MTKLAAFILCAPLIYLGVMRMLGAIFDTDANNYFQSLGTRGTPPGSQHSDGEAGR